MQRVLLIDQISPRIIYADTEMEISNEKEKFYNDLKDFLLSLPHHTTKMLAGDFNARIGEDKHEVFPNIVGKHCYHAATNDNCQRMIDLCKIARLRPLHSFFPNRKSRLATYRDPKGNLFQIDHIMISKKWWKSIIDCRTYNSMNISSDHLVVCAKFKLCLRKSKKTSNDRCKFNNEKLMDVKIKESFNMEL
ncbi:unnamed protein product [Brachionus calyciflorus]|uniref:Craniofacial development protein 2-like n=1 Tax=Brachionus calyciflorus TaxID=104777 RepID=A0A814BY00_9BILA|nr:unnamed protein product [Brachionus calyciflorus]